MAFHRVDLTSNAFYWTDVFSVINYAGQDAGIRQVKITLTDSASRQAVGYLGSVGSGIGAEAVDSEIIDAWANSGWETLNLSGTDILQAIETGSNAYVSKNAGDRTGQLIRFLSTITLGSGVMPRIILGSITAALSTTADYQAAAAAGLNQLYRSLTASNRIYHGLRAFDGATNFSAIGNSLKRVLDPPSTQGVHIFNARSGGTRGWESITASFLPNSISAYNLSSAYSHYLDMTSGNAFWIMDGIDLSPYAGNDAGYTPYRVTLLDTAGKTAVGYIGAVGSGWATGGDLLAGWNFTAPDWHPSTGCTVVDSNTITNAIANTGIAKWAFLTQNWLYKMVLAGTTGLLFGLSSANPRWVSPGFNGTYYATHGASFGNTHGWLYAPLAGTYDVTQMELYRVTEPPATGVHIMNSLGGTTRGWASVDAGFNPNNVLMMTLTAMGIFIPLAVMHYKKLRGV